MKHSFSTKIGRLDYTQKLGVNFLTTYYINTFLSSSTRQKGLHHLFAGLGSVPLPQNNLNAKPPCIIQNPSQMIYLNPFRIYRASTSVVSLTPPVAILSPSPPTCLEFPSCSSSSASRLFCRWSIILNARAHTKAITCRPMQMPSAGR